MQLLTSEKSSRGLSKAPSRTSINSRLRRLSLESIKKLQEEVIDINDEEKLRLSIIMPFERLRRESIKNLQQEEIDSICEEVLRPLLVVPLRRMSKNVEQAITNFFQTKPNSKELTKVDQIKLKMCDVLDDKEELRRFKAFARNNYVTTNIGIQQMLLKYAESHDKEVAEQTNHLAKHVSFDSSTRYRSHSNSQCNLYRVEKDERGGYKWISVYNLQCKDKPIRRRASINP